MRCETLQTYFPTAAWVTSLAKKPSKHPSNLRATCVEIRKAQEGCLGCGFMLLLGLRVVASFRRRLQG